MSVKQTSIFSSWVCLAQKIQEELISAKISIVMTAWYVSCWIDKQAFTVAQKALFISSLVWVSETNKHYHLTEQERHKSFLLFYLHYLLCIHCYLLYSLLILHVNYHHHELQQLLYKVTIHLNSHSQELQSMIHSYAEMTDRRRSIKCC